MSKFKNTMIEIDEQIASDVENNTFDHKYDGTIYAPYYKQKWDEVSAAYAAHVNSLANEYSEIAAYVDALDAQVHGV